MYTQTASHDDHHTPTGWKRWAYSTSQDQVWRRDLPAATQSMAALWCAADNITPGSWLVAKTAPKGH